MSPVDLVTRANSIDRALDQIGDKWSLLIIQEIYWGVHSFTGLLRETGASRGVLTDRLAWLVKIGCLKKQVPENGGKRAEYHLTHKSNDLYASALMAMEWEYVYGSSEENVAMELRHLSCGAVFKPYMCCDFCGEVLRAEDVRFEEGPGATKDVRMKKVRRRSSVTIDKVPTSRTLYKSLINIVGDRWTANVIALAFQNLKRFDEFHQELPIATNILSDRLRFLTQEGVFKQVPYQQQPLRYEYVLTEKGKAFFPYFVALFLWGNKWCDQGDGEPMEMYHKTCNRRLGASVTCNQCNKPLQGNEVDYRFIDTAALTHEAR
jgi:DNA-binding HxlR family transcriptional regulator